MNVTSKTMLNAGVGFPMKRSLGVMLHNEIYKKEHINATMLAFEEKSIKKFISTVRATPIHLSPVTAPHKQAVMPLLDAIDQAAREIGAVNTIINRDGKLTGFNTDLDGIAASLNELRLSGKKILVLGAGGVAQPLAYYLKLRDVHFYCLNRGKARAKALTKKFGGTALTKKQLNQHSFDVIINATTLGMSPKEKRTPIDAKHIKRGALVFDIVYRPLETRLLREAKKRGARTINGLKMFVAQALAQDSLWLRKKIRDRDYEKFLKKQIKN